MSLIKGSLDEIIEAVYKELKDYNGIYKEKLIRTALEKFVVCEECDGEGIIEFDIHSEPCPSCTTKKGGDDEG